MQYIFIKIIRLNLKGTLPFNPKGDGKNADFGNYVIIKTDGGNYVYYAHLKTHLLPNKPMRINVGDRLGIVGTTGRSTGIHLHVEIRQGSHRTSAPRLGL